MAWWRLDRKKRQRRQEIPATHEATPATSTEASPGPDKQTLYSRNWAYISPEIQDRLAKTTLFTAGAGLGSVVAVLAARTGVQRFIIADGDSVEESNLNRQAFTRVHLGQNKAEATAAIIRDIQPASQIEVVPRYLDTEDCVKLAARADIILNTIDLDTPAFLELNRAARAEHKPVLFPINPEWMGTVIVFTSDSQSLDEFLDIEHNITKDQAPLRDIALRLFEGIYAQVPGGMPQYLRSLIYGYFDQDINGEPGARRGAPQLGVTTYLTAALTVRVLVALVAGEPVRVAPAVITADAFSQVAPPL